MAGHKIDRGVPVIQGLLFGNGRLFMTVIKIEKPFSAEDGRDEATHHL